LKPTEVTAISQIGVVVENLERTVERYRELLGLGDWSYASVPTQTSDDSDEPVAARIAWTMLGQVELELIEPRTHTGIYADCLRERGPGLHHVMFSVAEYDGLANHMADHGIQVLRSGRLQHTRFRLFDTETDLGLIVEIAEGGSLRPED
jgi:methylmalonyl-CoA/ethylmalonyl-CoA epimerase